MARNLSNCMNQIGAGMFKTWSSLRRLRSKNDIEMIKNVALQNHY